MPYKMCDVKHDLRFNAILTKGEIMNADKINGYGAYLRFITPALIAIIGTLILLNLSAIKEKTASIDKDLTTLTSHFTNHMGHHFLLEKEYENRITTLEAR